MSALPEVDSSWLATQLHQVALMSADAVIETQRDLLAPHLIYGAVLSKDGNQWCWLYGDNLQDGIAGFGDTPEQAGVNFDRAWKTEKA